MLSKITIDKNGAAVNRYTLKKLLGCFHQKLFIYLKKCIVIVIKIVFFIIKIECKINVDQVQINCLARRWGFAEFLLESYLIAGVLANLSSQTCLFCYSYCNENEVKWIHM